MTSWTVGTVTLNVADLGAQIAFYEQVIGMRLHRRDKGSAALGTGGEDLLVLEHHPEARPRNGGTGLYHFALRVPTRHDLARVLAHLAKSRTPLQGVSDHLVSEAIYLADPEGNGIEIYRDRPREQWPYRNGRLGMATDPMDVDSVLGELSEAEFQAPYVGLPEGTDMGHVHLHVEDIAEAERFYRDLLGFDLMVRYGGAASFLARDGYHHHIGVNVWRRGQPDPQDDDNRLGLRHFELRLPLETLRQAEQKLNLAGFALRKHEDRSLVYDPVGNGIVLMSE